MSGEFHPWRLPVPQLWSDVLQKMKACKSIAVYFDLLTFDALQAAGFNTVSIYIHWGLTEGKPGSLNWDHFRSVELFYQIAQREGIYVIARPGVSLLSPSYCRLKAKFIFAAVHQCEQALLLPHAQTSKAEPPVV